MNDAIKAPMPPELAAAIVQAQSHARAVGKDAKNKFHGYKYASAEALIEEGRGALIEAGLSLMTLGWSLDVTDGAKPSTVDGSKGVVVGRVSVQYRLLHKSGAYIDFDSSTPVIPEKGRPEDKAEMAAITNNLGYTLRGLLLLPREDADGQVDQRDDRAYEPRQPRAAATTQQLPAGSQQQPANDPAFEGLLADIVRQIDEAPDLSGFGAINAAIKGANFPKPLADRAWSAFFRAGFRFAANTGELEEWGQLVIEAKLVEPALSEVRGAFDARFDALDAQAKAAA